MDPLEEPLFVDSAPTIPVGDRAVAAAMPLAVGDSSPVIMKGMADSITSALATVVNTLLSSVTEFLASLHRGSRQYLSLLGLGGKEVKGNKSPSQLGLTAAA
jgi:hypothetical protein